MNVKSSQYGLLVNGKIICAIFWDIRIGYVGAFD